MSVGRSAASNLQRMLAEVGAVRLFAGDAKAQERFDQLRGGPNIGINARKAILVHGVRNSTYEDRFRCVDGAWFVDYKKSRLNFLNLDVQPGTTWTLLLMDHGAFWNCGQWTVNRDDGASWELQRLN